MTSRRIVPLFLCIIAMTASCRKREAPRATAPTAQAGVLNLGQWDFQRDGMVRLDGEWEFHWRKLLGPDDFKTQAPAATQQPETRPAKETQPTPKTQSEPKSQPEPKTRPAKESQPTPKTQPEPKTQPTPKKASYFPLPRPWNGFQLGDETLGAFGYATYRLTVQLPEESGLLGLKLTDMNTAYRLYANGRLVASNGIPGTSDETTTAQWLPLAVILPPAGARLELVLQVSNFRHFKGGSWQSVLLGTERQIREFRERKMNLEMLIIVSCLLIGLYHLVLFAFRRRERAPLYLALACLVNGFRDIQTGERYLQHLTGMPWQLDAKAAYMSTTVLGMFFILFLASIFTEDFPRSVVRIIVILCCALSALFMALPHRFIGILYLGYMLLMLTGLAFSAYVGVSAFYRKRKYAAIFFPAPFLFLVSTFGTLLFYRFSVSVENMYIQQHLQPMSMLVFFVLLAIALAQKHADSYAAVEVLSDELRELNISYQRFVPAEFLRFLEKESILQIQLGDQVKTSMSILFSDTRSFTALSETMTPAENFNFLNGFFKRAAPLIREHNGVIDKYIGDAIMALFPTAPTDALAAAVRMRGLLEEYNEKRARDGFSPINIGIGIHTGEMMLGTVGEERRMETTVISDAVNLASRLEGLTKLYRAGILASGATVAASGAKFQTRLLGLVQVKGKLGAVAVHEVLDGEPARVREGKLATQGDFQAGLERYQAGRFKEASELFRRALAIFADDAAAALYLERSEHLLVHGAPADWDGIERREAK